MASLRSPAANVIVLDNGVGVRTAATVNRHLAGVFGFYEHHARSGVALAADLVAWRRVSRGSYKPFLHHATQGKAVRTRPIKLAVNRRLPRSLAAEQVVAILAACEHQRDRFLFALLAETGMRVGQALGLRHADFVSRRRELHIVPRADNANGARAKVGTTAVIPISAPLVRLYSDYMHTAYGGCDSDYVFVNLWGGRLGHPLTYATVHKLVALLRARSGELAFDPTVDDSVGWPCLRFNNSKVRIERLIPLSAKAASAIRAQQDLDRARWPAGTPWLFLGLLDNGDGSKPYARGSLSAQLRRWQAAIDLRDEAGEPVRVNAHRFRHTVGTRLINAGVPQHVVQKLLGHASPRMTGTYAALHDSTVRQAFDHYQAQRVDTAGQHVAYDPDATTASAEWVKHNLARIRDTLPNGYCVRPAQQDCPHPNACLTCPDFQTTPEFLDVHRRHAGANRTLIATADASGQFRLASNLRMVQDSLERIIPALEAIEER